MGRIRTQENIAVGTLLIGIATPIGGYMIVSESWLKPLSGRVSGRIRTEAPKFRFIAKSTLIMTTCAWPGFA